jgi:hypothetical protein
MGVVLLLTRLPVIHDLAKSKKKKNEKKDRPVRNKNKQTKKKSSTETSSEVATQVSNAYHFKRSLQSQQLLFEA